MNRLLCFTSTFFATNVIVGLYLGYIVYALLFFILMCTSLLYHSTHHTMIKKIDRMAVITVSIYGAYMIYQKQMFDFSLCHAMIIFCFLFCVVVYEYGEHIQQFSFDPNPFVSQFYHTCIHLYGSIGHHFVMLG